MATSYPGTGDEMKMKEFGMMDVAIQRAGKDIVLTKITNDRVYFKNISDQRLYKTQSFSYSVNTVLNFFSKMSHQQIVDEQFSVRFRPGARTAPLMRNRSFSDVIERVCFSLTIWNEEPFLIGQGDVFTPIPVGLASERILNKANIVEIAVFNTLMENLFREVSLLYVVDVLGVVEPSYKDHAVSFERVQEWVSQEEGKPDSPWKIEKVHPDSRRYPMVGLTGNPLPWNR